MEETKKSRVAHCCYTASVFCGLCATAAGVVVPLLQQRYGLSYTVTGALLAALSMGTLAAGLICAVLSERWGNRMVILTLCVGMALGYLLMPSTSIPALLMLAFLLLGITKGATINNASVLIAQAVPDRTKGMNLYNAGYALGALACPFIVVILCREGMPWQAPFWALALMGVFSWASNSAAPISFQLGKAEHGETGGWEFLRSGHFWLLTLLVFGQQATEVTICGLLVTYFRDMGLLSETASGYVVTLVWSCMLLSRLVVAKYGGRHNPFALLTLMCAGCTGSYLLLLLAKSPAVALIALALYGVSTAGLYPTGIAAAGSQLNSRSLGVMLPAAGIGAVIMPSICGHVAEVTNLWTGMACIMVPMVLMLAASVVCLRRIKPDSM